MMCEKRFVYGVIKGSRQAHIMDCHTCKSATIDVYDDDFKYFVDKLNELAEENEQLQQEVFVYKKAFQQQVRRCTL